MLITILVKPLDKNAEHEFSWHVQKQPSRGVLKKTCSKNMQQIYRRTPMPKCDFNKVALQLWTTASELVLNRGEFRTLSRIRDEAFWSK